MRQAEMIRLGVIALALLLAYSCVVSVVDFVSEFPHAGLRMVLRATCFAAASWVLIRYSRRITNFIDRQS